MISKLFFKKIFIAFLLALFAISQQAHAQSNPLDKQLDKAKEMAEKNKLADADEYLVKMLKKSPDYGTGWDYLAKVRYAEYKDAKKTDGFGGNIKMTTKGADGKDKPADDSLSLKLMQLLNNIKPSKKAYNKYMYTMRKAVLVSSDAFMSSITLRNQFVDPEVDTNVSKKALKYFNDAEEAFQKENYNDAAKYYKRAIDEQPDFYKARLYLGDSYYFQKNYHDAITSFQDAVKTFPGLIEPRKYLVDAYAKLKEYDLAMDEAIKAMAVYPDIAVLQKLDDAAYLINKKVDIKWIPRGTFPNKVELDTAKTDINEYTEKDDENPAKPWSFYAGALEKAKSFCNEKGMIVKPNSLTQSKYLEVYSWEEMLKNSTDPSLEEAKRMQKAGYLDCYVLVTCFHIDFYDQYKDFVLHNKDKVLEYYKKFIIPT